MTLEQITRYTLALGTPVLLQAVWRISWENRRYRRKIRKLFRRARQWTPNELFSLRRRKTKGGRSLATPYNVPGVYVLQNHTKRRYYVGQGRRALDRIHAHFTGRGNGDIYADYKYGDNFTIRLIPLKSSRYKTLNDLERHTIDVFRAYDKGYNRTRGSG